MSFLADFTGHLHLDQTQICGCALIVIRSVSLSLSVSPVQLPEFTDGGIAVDLHMCIHQVYCTIFAGPEQNRVRLSQ